MHITSGEVPVLVNEMALQIIISAVNALKRGKIAEIFLAISVELLLPLIRKFRESEIFPRV